MSARSSTWTITLLLGTLATVGLAYYTSESHRTNASESQGAIELLEIPDPLTRARALSDRQIEEAPKGRSELGNFATAPSATPPAIIPGDAPVSISPRRVWLEQTEWMATRMLEGDLAFEDAAETLSNLIDACDFDELEWKLIDGISTCSIMQSDDLGEAVVRAIPQSSEGSSGYQVELSFVDPPGVWFPGEARSSSLTFDLQLDEAGTPTYCSAFLNSSFRQASEGGPAANSKPLRSGAIMRLSNGQRSIQFLTTHVDASGNRTYKLQEPEPKRDEDLSSPGTTRLVQTLRGLRRNN